MTYWEEKQNWVCSPRTDTQLRFILHLRLKYSIRSCYTLYICDIKLVLRHCLAYCCIEYSLYGLHMWLMMLKWSLKRFWNLHFWSLLSLLLLEVCSNCRQFMYEKEKVGAKQSVLLSVEFLLISNISIYLIGIYQLEWSFKNIWSVVAFTCKSVWPVFGDF